MCSPRTQTSSQSQDQSCRIRNHGELSQPWLVCISSRGRRLDCPGRAYCHRGHLFSSFPAMVQMAHPWGKFSRGNSAIHEVAFYLFGLGRTVSSNRTVPAGVPPDRGRPSPVAYQQGWLYTSPSPTAGVNHDQRRAPNGRRSQAPLTAKTPWFRQHSCILQEAGQPSTPRRRTTTKAVGGGGPLPLARCDHPWHAHELQTQRRAPADYSRRTLESAGGGVPVVG